MPPTNSGLTEYKLLEPLPLGGSSTLVPSVNANNYLSGLFMLTIALAGAIAVLRLIYAGFLYMGTDVITNKNEAKGIINETLFGLGLVASTWLIVALVLSPTGNTLVFDLSLDPIKITAPTIPPVGPGTLQLTQAQAMEALKAGGVDISGTINIAGIRQTTIDELSRLHAECNCQVLVTSATGGEHAAGTYSHANGYKVDLRSVTSTGTDSPLTTHIKNTYQKLPDRSDGAKMYRAPGNGALYALESNHWDVQVIPGSGR